MVEEHEIVEYLLARIKTFWKISSEVEHISEDDGRGAQLNVCHHITLVCDWENAILMIGVE